VPELVANLAWGGPDFHTLYMCATHSVYSVKTKVGPRRDPYMQPRSGGGAPRSSGYEAPRPAPPAHASAPPPPSQQQVAPALKSLDRLDPSRCALIIQDMQNDVVMEGGAFASSGSPAHCKQQNAIANAMRLAEACRRRGVMVIHVWFIVEPGAPGVTLNAPLFEGLVESNAMVRGTWGAQPVPGLEAKPGDHVVEKMRMSAWEGSRLETVLKSGRRDIIIVTGAWTNMSIEHTARTGADKGYLMIVPEDCCSTMNADWHRASINYALQNVSAVTRADDVIAALG
jgi:gluconolactonase